MFGSLTVYPKEEYENDIGTPHPIQYNQVPCYLYFFHQLLSNQTFTTSKSHASSEKQ